MTAEQVASMSTPSMLTRQSILHSFPCTCTRTIPSSVTRWKKSTESRIGLVGWTQVVEKRYDYLNNPPKSCILMPCIHKQWYQSNPHQFHLVTLGTMHSLPSPVQRRSQKVYKPEFFETLKKEKDGRDGVRLARDWIVDEDMKQVRMPSLVQPLPDIKLILRRIGRWCEACRRMESD